MTKFVIPLMLMHMSHASEPIRKEKTRHEVRYTKAITQKGVRKEYVVWRTALGYQGKLYTFSKKIESFPPECWLPDAEQYFKQFEREYQASKHE
jgi:hypothetical protein